MTSATELWFRGAVLLLLIRLSNALAPDRALLQRAATNPEANRGNKTCPPCEIPEIRPPRRFDDKSLFTCGCENRCSVCASCFINGCTKKIGRVGIEFEIAFEDTMRPVCNMHDVCYYCNDLLKTSYPSQMERRKKCDDMMKDMMLQRCDTVYGGSSPGLMNRNCKRAANVYYVTTRALGDIFFPSNEKHQPSCAKNWLTLATHPFHMYKGTCDRNVSKTETVPVTGEQNFRVLSYGSEPATPVNENSYSNGDDDGTENEDSSSNDEGGIVAWAVGLFFDTDDD